MGDFAVLEDSGGVMEAAAGTRRIAVDVAGDERNVADRLRERLEAVEAARDEVVAQEEVAGRVAAEKEFRCEDEFRALADGFAIRRFESRAILVKAPMVALSWRRPIRMGDEFFLDGINGISHGIYGHENWF